MKNTPLLIRSAGAKRENAFTLIELLAVVAIVILLLAILLPVLGGARERGRSAVCTSNMRQLSLGVLNYAPDNGGYFPWAGGQDRNLREDWVWGGQPKAHTENKAYWDNPPNTFGFHAEAGAIFPYVTGMSRMTNGSGYRGIDETIRTIYPIYRCPSTEAVGQALRVNFSMNDRLDGGDIDTNTGVEKQGARLSHVKRLSSKILLVNEDPRTMHNASLFPMGSAGGVTGNGDAFDGGLLHIMHYGGINISFMDGHVARVTHSQFMGMQKNVPAYFEPTL